MTQPFPRHTGGELMDESTFSELYAPARRAPAAAPRAAAPLSRPAALEAQIDRAGSREAVDRLGVTLARSYAAASALLLVHRGLIQGLRADGLPGRPDVLLFPVDAPSVFGEVAASGRAWRGAPRPAGLDARILRAIGRAQVREIAVLPVRLGGRVVNLVYADNGPELLGDASVAALGAVCTRIGRAYERLIRERKRA